MIVEAHGVRYLVMSFSSEGSGQIGRRCLLFEKGWVFEQQAQLIGNHRLRTGNVSQAVPHT